MLPDWPTYLGAPQARGRLRSVPEDFEVEEQFDVELASMVNSIGCGWRSVAITPSMLPAVSLT